MRLAPQSTTALRLACLIALATFAGGCLAFQEAAWLTYDSKADEFRYLLVLEHIHSTNDPVSDMDWLKTINANRDHLILTSRFWNYLKISNHEFAEISLSNFQAVPHQVDAETSEFSLDDIRIVPGRFFLQGKDNLSYYHELVVRGRAVDSLLKEVNEYLESEAPFGALVTIDKELDRRRDGGRSMNWDEFTLASIERARASLDGKQSDMELQCPLETRSLQIIRQALADRRFPLQRHGSQFELTVEMTARDVAGTKKFFADGTQFLHDAIQEASKNGHELPSEMKDSRFLRNLFDIESLDKTHLRLTIDLIQACDAIREMEISPRPTPPDELQKDREMADFAASELNARDDLSTQQIAADFKAGRLKPSPPSISVEPGTGMGPIKRNSAVTRP
jgi:hypothetical protein